MSHADDLLLVTACRDALAKTTPGPWRWFGQDTEPYLATNHSGRKFILSGDTRGLLVRDADGQMQHSKNVAVYEVCPAATSHDDPRVYRRDIMGLRSPDAMLLAAAPDVTSAALSLIEDTLRRHREIQYVYHPTKEDDNGELISTGDPIVESTGCGGCVVHGHPCPDYRAARTALHTIATALGIDPE